MPCPVCRKLLSDGLDLCVRARKMDAIDRRANALTASVCPEEWEQSGLFDKWIEMHNAEAEYWHQPIETRSLTIPMWLQDQYDKDLAEWEQESRKHLMAGCENGEEVP